MNQTLAGGILDSGNLVSFAIHCCVVFVFTSILYYKKEKNVTVILMGNASPFFIGGDSDELEEELKTLLEKTIPDSNDVLPEVPMHPVFPVKQTGLSEDDFIQSLPAVPNASLGITDEELDRELSQLSVSDTGDIFSTGICY